MFLYDVQLIANTQGHADIWLSVSLYALTCSSQHIKQDSYKLLTHPNRHIATHTHIQIFTLFLSTRVDYTGVKPNCLSCMLGAFAKSRLSLLDIFPFQILFFSLTPLSFSLMFFFFTEFNTYPTFVRLFAKNPRLMEGKCMCVLNMFLFIFIFCTSVSVPPANGHH